MKSFRFIGMALFSLLMFVNFVSCSNNEEVISEELQEEKYITVGLGCTGEFLEVTHSPLGRNAVDELYKIQVYEQSESNRQVYYAYGIFTSLEDVKIKLLNNVKYKFNVSIILEPFKLGLYDQWGDITNEFIYSREYSVGVEDINCINYDCYYGEYAEYTPEEGGEVAINTKRVVYGIKCIAQNLDEGKLKIQVGTRHGLNDNGFSACYDIELTPTISLCDEIYTFDDVRSAWLGNPLYDEEDIDRRNPIGYTNYTTEKMLNVSWEKADNTIVPLGTYPITVERNIRTTITIKAEDLNSVNSIKVLKNTETIEDADKEYFIEGGDIIDVEFANGNANN